MEACTGVVRLNSILDTGSSIHSAKPYPSNYFKERGKAILNRSCPTDSLLFIQEAYIHTILSTFEFAFRAVRSTDEQTLPDGGSENILWSPGVGGATAFWTRILLNSPILRSSTYDSVRPTFLVRSLEDECLPLEISHPRYKNPFLFFLFFSSCLTSMCNP